MKGKIIGEIIFQLATLAIDAIRQGQERRRAKREAKQKGVNNG